MAAAVDVSMTVACEIEALESAAVHVLAMIVSPGRDVFTLHNSSS